MSAAPAVAVLAAVLGAIVNGLHTIHEGHIGVYWRGGALMERTSGPGVHWRFPLLDRHEEARARAPARARESGRRFLSSSPRPISSPVPLSRLAARRAVREQVQTTIQTDSVSEIPCGTSGGVVVTFDKVEVVNRLDAKLARATVANYTTRYDQPWIFDKVRENVPSLSSERSLRSDAYLLLLLGLRRGAPRDQPVLLAPHLARGRDRALRPDRRAARGGALNSRDTATR